MSEKYKVEHKYCGTPLCCGQCESAIMEDAAANSVGSSGYSGSAETSGPTAGYDPVVRFRKKMQYRIMQRKKKKAKG
jgi:hypothetical protein